MKQTLIFVCLLILGLATFIFVCLLILSLALVIRAQSRKDEILDITTTFHQDMIEPLMSIKPFLSFAQEVATIQRERNAAIAESFNRPDIAKAIREAK